MPDHLRLNPLQKTETFEDINEIVNRTRTYNQEAKKKEKRREQQDQK